MNLIFLTNMQPYSVEDLIGDFLLFKKPWFNTRGIVHLQTLPVAHGLDEQAIRLVKITREMAIKKLINIEYNSSGLATPYLCRFELSNLSELSFITKLLTKYLRKCEHKDIDISNCPNLDILSARAYNRSLEESEMKRRLKTFKVNPVSVSSDKNGWTEIFEDMRLDKLIFNGLTFFNEYLSFQLCQMLLCLDLSFSMLDESSSEQLAQLVSLEELSLLGVKMNYRLVLPIICKLKTIRLLNLGKVDVDQGNSTKFEDIEPFIPLIRSLPLLDWLELSGIQFSKPEKNGEFALMFESCSNRRLNWFGAYGISGCLEDFSSIVCTRLGHGLSGHNVIEGIEEHNHKGQMVNCTLYLKLKSYLEMVPSPELIVKAYDIVMKLLPGTLWHEDCLLAEVMLFECVFKLVSNDCKKNLIQNFLQHAEHWPNLITRRIVDLTRDSREARSELASHFVAQLKLLDNSEGDWPDEQDRFNVTYSLLSRFRTEDVRLREAIGEQNGIGHLIDLFLDLCHIDSLECHIIQFLLVLISDSPKNCERFTNDSSSVPLIMKCITLYDEEKCCNNLKYANCLIWFCAENDSSRTKLLHQDMIKLMLNVLKKENYSENHLTLGNLLALLTLEEEQVWRNHMVQGSELYCETLKSLELFITIQPVKLTKPRESADWYKLLTSCAPSIAKQWWLLYLAIETREFRSVCARLLSHKDLMDKIAFFSSADFHANFTLLSRAILYQIDMFQKCGHLDKLIGCKSFEIDEMNKFAGTLK